jgi:hypothetical protein
MSKDPFLIESNVPVPETRGRSTGLQFPFEQMQIGDSFFLEKEKIATARTAADSYRKRHPEWDFTTRKDGEGCRLWRVTVKEKKVFKKKKKK